MTSDDPSLALVGSYSSNTPVDNALLYCAELQNAYNRQGTVVRTPMSALLQPGWFWVARVVDANKIGLKTNENSNFLDSIF